jgi:hypothetical protein
LNYIGLFPFPVIKNWIWKKICWSWKMWKSHL